ncbi:MAG TPA: bifunctional UDP-sugar hydrolase/5'-nucleotidase [Acidobacteriota bacterium]
MTSAIRRFALCAALLLIAAAAGAESSRKEVTLLYTNDFHSAIDPIPAYWMEGSPRRGGAAELASMIRQIRARDPIVFLFDTGDMFTGMLSFLTRGEALIEMMITMGYDAMAIGNHEFDYGADNFERQMFRAPFPILGANIFYKGTDHRYSRPYAILERGGVRLGVIGIIGQDARSVALPSGITELEFPDPIPAVAAAVRELRPAVDLIVVLAHQGKTGPMQTDAEAHADLQRDFDEDIRLCGAVEGIDVFIGGHAHRGIETPYVHPESGTLIVQTYGYGTRLGYLKLALEDGKLAAHQGELLKVWSDRLEPDPAMVKKLEPYRRQVAPQIGEVLATTERRLVRDYRAESLLGSFVADVMRLRSGADIAITNAGGLRADLPQGEVTKGHVLDALPFVNTLVTFAMTGAQIREVLEQGLTLERGLPQVSGLRAVYDLSRPPRQRLLELRIGGAPVEDARSYRVATNSFLGQGGDLYQTFLESEKLEDGGVLLSELVMDYLREQKRIEPPESGRWVPAAAE